MINKTNDHKTMENIKIYVYKQQMILFTEWSE